MEKCIICHKTICEDESTSKVIRDDGIEGLCHDSCLSSFTEPIRCPCGRLIKPDDLRVEWSLINGHTVLSHLTYHVECWNSYLHGELENESTN